MTSNNHPSFIEGEIEYESLPANTSRLTHILAGALAGMSEHSVMYPIDSIKTRMQIVKPVPAALYHNFTDAIRKISASKDGFAQLWRGISSVILGAGPAHALYFSTYEEVRKLLVKRGDEGSSPIYTGVSGACATIISDAFMNPFDVVKQRMQAHGSHYKNVICCTMEVYSKEGIKSFYISYPTTLILNVPFQAIQFPVYEYFRHSMNPTEQYSPLTHVLSGCLAGSIASALTTPVDVIKTLLQTKGTSSEIDIRNASGIRDAVGIIYRYYGLSGFWRGLVPRILTHMPATAVCWTTYEYFKYLIPLSTSSRE